MKLSMLRLAMSYVRKATVLKFRLFFSSIIRFLLSHEIEAAKTMFVELVLRNITATLNLLLCNQGVNNRIISPYRWKWLTLIF